MSEIIQKAGKYALIANVDALEHVNLQHLNVNGLIRENMNRIGQATRDSNTSNS